jgi:hypothetical protein
MAVNRIDILLTANDKASAEIKKSEKTISSFSKKVQADFVNIAAKVFVVQQAYRALSSVVGGLINAANRQEDATNRLNNALRIQGSYTERLSSKYQKLAADIQRSTRFGDEEVMELMQQLISIGNVTESQMERAARAATDFAAATGRDLKTAALTVGKAMAGTTGELSRYGIILDQNIPKTKKAEAALEAMEKQFGTAAQRDIGTFSGQVAQLGNVWSDFQETLGTFITKSKISEAVIYGLSESIQWLNKVVINASGAMSGMSERSQFLVERLKDVDAALEANLKKQSAPFLMNRNQVEEEYNNLLVHRSRILLTLKRFQAEDEATAQSAPTDVFETQKAQYSELEKAEENLAALKLRLSDDDMMRKVNRVEQDISLLKHYEETFKTSQMTMASFAITASTAFQQSFSNAFTGIVTGTKKASDGFKEMGKAMLESIVAYFAKMMASQVALFVLEKTILSGKVAASTAAMAATTAAGVAQGAALTAAYTPAAIAANIMSFGGAAVAAAATFPMAGAAYASSMAAATAAAQGLGSGAAALGGGAGRSISVDMLSVSPQAKGGDYMVNKPTLFLAGEAGPERATFTPIGKTGGGGDGIGEVNIYIQGGVRPDGRSVESLAETLGFEFARQVRVARG